MDLTEKDQRQLDASVETVRLAHGRGDHDALMTACRDVLRVLRPPSELAAVEADPLTGGASDGALRTDQMTRDHALIKLCRAIFTSNVIGTDFDDVQAIKVVERNFPQQPGGGGLHISFSVSWHALGKTGQAGHDALGVFLPDKEAEADDTDTLLHPAGPAPAAPATN